VKAHLPANALSTTPQDTTALCLACGFCCNGVLHTYTKVAAREVDALQRLGTQVYAIQGENVFAFDQPCPHWQENRCAIYVHRPKSCRTYECLLYKKLAAGLISLPDSLEQLQKAQALRAQCEASVSAE
jgi:Fe-S-cluster containining protein